MRSYCHNTTFAFKASTSSKALRFLEKLEDRLNRTQWGKSDLYKTRRFVRGVEVRLNHVIAEVDWQMRLQLAPEGNQL